MTTYHSNEFSCDWDYFAPFEKIEPSIQEPKYQELALEMMENCEVEESDDCSTHFFKSDYAFFKTAVFNIKKNIAVDAWMEVFNNFFHQYPTFKKDECIKTVELFQASKSNHLLKNLDMTNDLDIKVYMEIIKLRNDIYSRHNIIHHEAKT
jgi:hypothetical protein